jgi:hypothetical protein
MVLGNFGIHVSRAPDDGGCHLSRSFNFDGSASLVVARFVRSKPCGIIPRCSCDGMELEALTLDFGYNWWDWSRFTLGRME